MYDLHTHTYVSDGVLGLSELTRRCQRQGYKGLAITDHCDHANIEEVVRRACHFCEQVSETYGGMKILAGCELTHVPPALIPQLTDKARELGADIVLVHGETVVEPVAEGTNRAAVDAGVDVLAHPGLIDVEDVARAAEREVMLEISGRKGHCYTNGHVARLADESGARLSFGSDGHRPGDYPDRSRAIAILRGAGLSAVRAEKVLENCRKVFER